MYLGIVSRLLTSSRTAERLYLLRFHPPKMTAKLLLLDNSFAQPHPPMERFVANKRQTAIRPNGHRAVKARFSLRFGLESRASFCRPEIVDFTF
jgi:hypothetical protein